MATSDQVHVDVTFTITFSVFCLHVDLGHDQTWFSLPREENVSKATNFGSTASPTSKILQQRMKFTTGQYVKVVFP